MTTKPKKRKDGSALTGGGVGDDLCNIASGLLKTKALLVAPMAPTLFGGGGGMGVSAPGGGGGQQQVNRGNRKSVGRGERTLGVPVQMGTMTATMVIVRGDNKRGAHAL